MAVGIVDHNANSNRAAIGVNKGRNPFDLARQGGLTASEADRRLLSSIDSRSLGRTDMGYDQQAAEFGYIGDGGRARPNQLT